MNNLELYSAVLEILQRPGCGAMSASDIVQALELRGKKRKKIQKLLNVMVIRGDIVADSRNRYAIGRPDDMVTGRIDIVRSGDGFVTVEGREQDIRVSKWNLSTALPGDIVRLRLTSSRRRGTGGESHRGSRARRHDGAEIKVVGIVERSQQKITGTLRRAGRSLYVVPMDPAYRRNFFVSGSAGARAGDRVVVEFTRWESETANPEGRIVEVIGSAETASLDTITIIRDYNYAEKFPDAVLREAEHSIALMKHPGQRLDLRDKFIFTIDPLNARDFDDALSLDTDSMGRLILGVHIADVSHFVRPGTALDKEARRRGNSVYFPDRVLPMLPESLSNGVCSLAPGEDRLAFSVFITVDNAGRPVETNFARSIIRSGLRLNYGQAMAALKTEDGRPCKKAGMSAEDVRLIKKIGRLAQQFRSRRFAASALDLDVPEYEITLLADGTVADVKLAENDESHQLIEECMVAANEAVDAELSDRGIPLIHRVHEPPSAEKIEDLTVKLAEMGFQPGNLGDRRAIARFLESVADSPLVYHVRTAVLRSMRKAVYSPVPKGHYGLAKKYYAHFTSPIRRYPDLVVHRILSAAFSSENIPYRKQDLVSISSDCSATEQMAEQAERSLMEIKKYRLLAQELTGRKRAAHSAVVVGIMRFGMFVELTDLQIQGLVHFSMMGGRSVRYNEAQRVLHAGRKQYRIGTPVEVFVTGVDFDKRRVDFALDTSV